MSDIHGKVRTRQSIGGKVTASSAVSGELDKSSKGKGGTKDYNLLTNKPSIEDVELKGNKKITDFGIPYVFYNTVEGWNEQASLITIKDAIYVYTDYKQDDQGRDVAGIKIGDGLGYLIDAPFLDGELYDHITNSVIHVTAQDKENWNNKVRCFIDASNTENLIFTTN